jgi:hypothetical protein
VEPLTIAALLGAAAIQQHSQSQALKKQQAQAREMRQRQLNAQNQATAKAARKATEFDPNARGEQQAQIEQALTGELNKQVAQPQITAQGVQVGQTIPGGTQDYLTAKAKETAKTTESLRALASLMGRVGSSSELRRKEAVGIGDTMGDIGRIQNGANNMAGIDQIGINSVTPNPWMQLASTALSVYGAANAGAGAKAAYPEYGMASGPTGAWL